jgi:RHS repeat-associated protein
MSTTSAGSTTNYYYEQDQTGSVANILKADGTEEYSYRYQPYGLFRSSTRNDTTVGINFNPMGFDSEYRDTGTGGLIDLRARMYDPNTSNFMTADAAGMSPDYNFASGNPTMFSDPSGMFSIWGWVGIAIAAAATCLIGVCEAVAAAAAVVAEGGVTSASAYLAATALAYGAPAVEGMLGADSSVGVAASEELSMIGSPSEFDPMELQGLTEEQVVAKIPDEWPAGPSKFGGGWFLRIQRTQAGRSESCLDTLWGVARTH